MSLFVTQVQKGVKYIWIPEIMLDDLVHKGHAKLNMFSIFAVPFKSLRSKQSEVNFWNRLDPKIAFLCRFLTQTATWQPNLTMLSLSFNAIRNTGFLQQV